MSVFTAITAPRVNLICKTPQKTFKIKNTTLIHGLSKVTLNCLNSVNLNFVKLKAAKATLSLGSKQI